MSLLPVDVIGTLYEALKEDKRPSSGLMRCASELIGPLRHAQLRLAGAPTIESELTQEIILKTGNMWHEYVGEVLLGRGVPVVRELNVTPWLPEGWGGIADYLFFDPEYQAWVLADLKTQKGESFFYLEKEGAKIEHIWQLSAYYHALVEAGFEVVEGFSVIYLPKNNTPRNKAVEPYIADCTPLPKEEVWEQMETRYTAVSRYLNGEVELEPPQERLQSYWWNAKQGVFDVKLVPHWSAEFCPYPDDLCDCNTAGTTKIGQFKYYEGDGLPDWPDTLVYEPRKGFEEIVPTVKPTEKEVAKRYAANN